MRKLQAAGLIAAFASLASLACGTDENSSLNSQSAQQVGGALAAVVGGMPASFTATDVSSGSIGGGFFAPPAQAVASWAAPSVIRPGTEARPLMSNRLCPDVDDLTDGDGDGVPDDATFTFDQAQCTNGSFYIDGTIHIVDPSASAVGYNGTFSSFIVHFTGQGNDFAQIELNGTHSVLGTPSTGTLSEDVVIDLSGQSGSQTLTGSLAHDWTIQFAAAQGQSIVMDDLLPDGDFTLTGQFVYDVNGERFALSVNTQTALSYDSSCVGQAHPFTGGVLQAHAGGPNGQVYVQITYNGCGLEPTVEFHGNNS